MGLLFFSSVLLNSLNIKDGINGLLQADKKPLNDFTKASINGNGPMWSLSYLLLTFG
jgi:hypothetical protein